MDLHKVAQLLTSCGQILLVRVYRRVGCGAVRTETLDEANNTICMAVLQEEIQALAACISHMTRGSHGLLRRPIGQGCSF